MRPLGFAAMVLACVACGRIAFDIASDAATIDTVPGDAAATSSLVGIIKELGLDSGLMVCLDAGDIASYDGGSQVWTNTAPAAMGTSFYRGGDGASAGDDPAFAGIAGGLDDQAHFAFDGDDWFQEATSAWGDDAFHMASERVTIVAMIAAVDQGMFRIVENGRFSQSSVFSNGISFLRYPSGNLSWYQEGDNNLGGQTITAFASPVDAWVYAAVSVDSNGTTSDVMFVSNTAMEAFPAEPEMYGTMPADRPMTIGASGDGQARVAAGARIAMVAIWNRALSAIELSTLYGAVKARRFPTLP